MFLEGGTYQEWTSADKNVHRIPRLNQNDRPGPEEGTAAELLIERQTQLATLLTIVGGIVHNSQYKDVMRRSTSMKWIWNLIETDYDIQKKGRHFLTSAFAASSVTI